MPSLEGQVGKQREGRPGCAPTDRAAARGIRRGVRRASAVEVAAKPLHRQLPVAGEAPAQAVSADGFHRAAEGAVESIGERREPLEERQRRRVEAGEHQAAMNGELRHAREVGLVRMAGAGESRGRAVFALAERALAARAKIDEGF